MLLGRGCRYGDGAFAGAVISLRRISVRAILVKAILVEDNLVEDNLVEDNLVKDNAQLRKSSRTGARVP